VSFPEESVKDPKKEPDKKGVKAPPSPPPRSRNVLERLEAQILALEWEITEENIRKTGEQVRRLKNNFSGQREVISILGFMEKALHQMMENDESIGPSLTRFLLDAKEMLKLLTNGEEEGDQAVYRRMACEGMEAKFSLVEQLKEKKSCLLLRSMMRKNPPKGSRRSKALREWKKRSVISVRRSIESRQPSGRWESKWLKSAGRPRSPGAYLRTQTLIGSRDGLQN